MAFIIKFETKLKPHNGIELSGRGSQAFGLFTQICFAILSWNFQGLLFAPHSRSVPENG